MPMNKIPKLREPHGPIVQQVRDLFLSRDYKDTPDDFYPQDVQMIESMDFLLQRCVIMQRKNVEASAKMVSQLLRWRKEKQLYEMKDSQFPQELSICGAAFVYEDDKFGNRTLYLRASMCRNCAELKNAMKDFLTHLLFQIDDSKHGSTYAVIMDLTKTTWTNYDLDLLMHFVNLLKDYFPVNLDYVLAINFPWILSTAWAFIKRLIPAEKRDVVQFISSDKVFDFIPKQNCPDFLGGTCERPYTSLCHESLNSLEYITKCATKPLTKKRLREIVAMFADILPEHQMSKLNNYVENYDPNNVTIAKSDEELAVEEELSAALEAASVAAPKDSDTNNNVTELTKTPAKLEAQSKKNKQKSLAK